MNSAYELLEEPLTGIKQPGNEDFDSGPDNRPIFSSTSMSTFLSATTLGPKTGRMHDLFVQEFAILLKEDEALRSLILEAVSKQDIGPRRARNNFRKLLKHFASDLRVESVNNHHQALVRFTNTNLSNIAQELFSEFSSDDQKSGDKMLEPGLQQDAARES
ncbi:hypothetical protein H0G86_002160 [Trichoderma simmonsii]|uniref:Uncharacterized protein n=1 Tax=Trichoderma simmonsii TaxID=1491479 RepID=A0A8G0L626_9HYPO|nr:hypothetical protein H0G86_002160 [Trichoderma simmonsii]